MKAVYKYPLLTTEIQFVELPFGAEILCLKMQNGRPCIWALVDSTAPKILHKFVTYGTGHYTEDACPSEYVGTYQLHNGEPFHVFDKGRQK